MRRLDIKLADIADRMVRNLIDHAKWEEVDITKITDIHELDDVFRDGGEVRCEQFADIAWEYSNQFGKFGTTAWENAQATAVSAALKLLKKQHCHKLSS